MNLRRNISVLMSLFWLGVAIIVYIQAELAMKLRGEPDEWFITLIVSMGWVFWALVSPLVIRATLPVKVEKGHLLKPFLVYILWSIVFVIMHVVFELVLFNLFLNPSKTFRMPDYIVYHIHAHFLSFLFIVFMAKGVEFYDRYNTSRLHAEKLNNELISARLGALKMQLNPHFLFNTHHSIISLMLKNENKKAISMLTKLSDFLRTTLDNNNQLSPLSDEIRLMKFYLDIQQIRLGDKLTVEIDVPENLAKAAVPTFILQPAIENAIIHGITPYSQPATLAVKCTRQNGSLEIEIYDDGGGIVHHPIREGIGLKNTRGRLSELFNDMGGVQVQAHPVKGTVTRIWMPYVEYNLPTNEQGAGNNN